MAFWTNQLHGPSRRATFFLAPALILMFCGGAYWLVDRYYQRAFGRVKETAGNCRADWILGTLGGAAGLAAFWMEVTLRPAVSAVGLILGAAILRDYLRLVAFARVWYAPFTLVYALLLVLVSVLGALGWDQWWRTVSVRTEMLAVLMVAGVVFILGDCLFLKREE